MVPHQGQPTISEDKYIFSTYLNYILMNSLEFTILNNLVTNDQFRRQAFPYLKKEYFEEEHNKLLFDLISNFIDKYGKCPTKESLAIDLQNVTSLTDQQFKNFS
ncbi:MAG: hypothetical protein CM15mV5_1630 [uncultured marine virus]|nr:MAG: hypothetical protein CM15mV5_1630 [uncultured marine virus]